MTRQNARAFTAVGQNGLALIKGFEGVQKPIDGGARAQAYRCPAHVRTIGRGHTDKVKEGQIGTREDFLRYRKIKPKDGDVESPGLTRRR